MTARWHWYIVRHQALETGRLLRVPLGRGLGRRLSRSPSLDRTPRRSHDAISRVVYERSRSASPISLEGTALRRPAMVPLIERIPERPRRTLTWRREARLAEGRSADRH